VCPHRDHNLANRVDSYGALVVGASVNMSRLTADRRVLRDRLDDAVYLVRATGLKASGIEAVLSGSSAGGGVVSAVLAYARPPGSQRRVHRDLRQRLVSVHWALAHFPTEDLSPHLEGRDKVSRCQTKSSDLLPPPLLIGTSLLVGVGDSSELSGSKYGQARRRAATEERFAGRKQRLRIRP
jgi:hypothetical protein